jgi:hypothetical protein
MEVFGFHLRVLLPNYISGSPWMVTGIGGLGSRTRSMEVLTSIHVSYFLIISRAVLGW